MSQRKEASFSGQNLSVVFGCCCVIVIVVVLNFSHFHFHPESQPFGQFKLVWGGVWKIWIYLLKNQSLPGIVYEKTSCVFFIWIVLNNFQCYYIIQMNTITEILKTLLLIYLSKVKVGLNIPICIFKQYTSLFVLSLMTSASAR